MSQAARAIVLAAERHKDQVDKAGQPYIRHCLRVGMKFTRPHLQTIGYLHDILEDTDTSAAELRQLGFDEHVISMVELLTHDPTVPYERYILGVSLFEDSRKVKIADLEDNMDLTRITSELTDKDIARLRKYHAAWRELTR